MFKEKPFTKKFKLLVITLILSLSGFVFLKQYNGYVYAEEETSETEEETEKEEEKLTEEREELEDKIKEYEKKIEELGNQKNTLESEIEYADSQISLTQLRIQNITNQIAAKARKIEKLGQDIIDLANRIDRIAESIEYQAKILAERKRSYYKVEQSTPKGFELLLFLIDPSQLERKIQKTTYSQVMQEKDKDLLDSMNKTKTAYDNQKGIFEDKKEEEEQLKAEIEVQKASLENYKTQLDNQRAQKEQLLKDTQNNEAKYQQLLEEARRELHQITAAVSVLKNQSGEKVEKGDLIGYQGNTGYSFGEHLHFGVYRYSSFEEIEGWNWYYNNYVDPLKVLKSKTVTWSTDCRYDPSGSEKSGKGDWNWPMDSPTISQNYGSNTCYNWMYGGKVHPALDMYSGFGSPIYAVEDGIAYYCRNCLGDGGNGVFIFHDDNYMTVYWHLR